MKPSPSLADRRALGPARLRSTLAVLAALGLLLLAAPPPAPAAPAAQSGLEGYQLVEDWTTRQPQGLLLWERPAGLDVAPDETIWAVDRDLAIVYRLDAGGAMLETWSDVRPAGRPPLDVAFVTDPAEGGRLFVVSAEGGEIRSARDGRVLGSWSLDGTKGVAVGPDRRVYVAHSVQGQFGAEAAISLRDVGGNELDTWTDDRFFVQDPAGLAVGADGLVYLASGDGAVYAWRDGQIKGLLRFRSEIEGGPVADVAADAEGRVFGLQRSPGREPRLAGWDVGAADWDAGGAGATYLGDAAVRGALHVASGPGAGLVASTSDTDFDGISRLRDRGDLDAPIDRWGSSSEALGELHAPQRLAMAPSGGVYIGDGLERVQLWNAAGEPQRQWPAALLADVAGGGDRPCVLSDASLACLSDSDVPIWSSDVGAESWRTAIDGTTQRVAAIDLGAQRLEIYDRDGRPDGGWDLPSTAGFTVVSDVALDGDRVYLADRTARKVGVFTLGGVLLGQIDVPGGPTRVAARDGEVFTLSREGWVWRYDATSTLRSVWRPAPDGKPSDLAIGPEGRVYVADPRMDRVRVFAPGGPPPDSIPQSPDGRCEIQVDKRAAPESVEIGETVTIALDIEGACPSGDGRLDVVLVLDRSGSMAGAPIAAARQAVVSFLGELVPGAAQASLVGFSTSEEVLQPLTGDLQAMVSAVKRLTAAGQTNFAPALAAAQAELEGPAARPDVPRIVVMMTDGRPTDRSRAPAAAEALKGAGVTLYTIGLGPDVDRDLLQEMASSEDDSPLYFTADSELELADVYADIGRRIAATRLLEAATVIDELPQDMAYVNDSAFPPARWDGAARTLTWDLGTVPAGGERLFYQVKPRRPGLRQTNVRATLDYRDVAGFDGRAVFPIPIVNVRERTLWQAWLPYTSRNVCVPQRVDVMLVFDNSSSMQGAAGSEPGTKMDAALRAGRIFLNQLQLPEDRAGIVTFDANARLEQQLTGTRAALEQALGRITTGSGTRIDLGIDRAFIEMLSPRHDPRHAAVMVVLSDGLPAGGTELNALRSARAARAAGIALYTIGLGSDADPFLLSEIAGDHRRSFLAPDASSLAGIYEQIAGRVLCD